MPPVRVSVAGFRPAAATGADELGPLILATETNDA